MTKLKKLTDVLLSVALMLCMFCVPAGAADDLSKAVAVKSGQKISADISAGKTNIYKFTVAEYDVFEIEMEAVVPMAYITLINAKGEEFLPEVEATNGWGGFDDKFKTVTVGWDPEKTPLLFSGVLTYYLDKGTYYLKVKTALSKDYMAPEDLEKFIANGDKEGKGSYKLTFNYNAAAEISYLTIPMKKGDTLTLSAVISGDTADTVKWSSSKKSVASVSKSGKITARKAGTAVITAKLGESIVKVQIKVTK